MAANQEQTGAKEDQDKIQIEQLLQEIAELRDYLKDQYEKTVKQSMDYDTTLERKDNEIAQLKIDIE
jgi:hypothetical protein